MIGLRIKEEALSLLESASNIPAAKITGEMSISTDLGLDSFAVVELVYELELKFHIKISDDDIKKIKTINQLIARLEFLVNAK